MTEKIKLQVVCITYNQAKFIKDALDGFVMQKTNFPFEVLVGDDCSTDGTSDIIAEYAKKYPNIIKHIRHEHNMGGQKNSIDIMKRVTAPYMALCEGDDYWTDPNKLQMQVDILENNKHLNGCFHRAEIRKEPNVKYWYSDSELKPDKQGRIFWPNYNFHPKNNLCNIKDIIEGCIATASVVYRYDKNFQYPEWFEDVFIAGDRAMHSFMIKSGYFYYIDRPMSIYRMAKGSNSSDNGNLSNIAQTTQQWLDLFDKIDKYFDYTYKHIIEDEKHLYVNAAFKNVILNKHKTALIDLINNYPDYAFSNLHYNEKVKEKRKKIYKILGIPVWKIVSRGDKDYHYLFGLIKVIEAESY